MHVQFAAPTMATRHLIGRVYIYIYILFTQIKHLFFSVCLCVPICYEFFGKIEDDKLFSLHSLIV